MGEQTVADLTWFGCGNDVATQHFVKEAVEKLVVAPQDLRTVVDIGAHVGTMSVIAARRGAERVFAVEPDHENYIALVGNVIRNGVWGRVVPLPFAVAPRSGGEAVLRGTGNTGQVSSLFAGANDFPRGPEFSREIGFLDLLLLACDPDGDRREIDLLKIDVEGAEWGFLTDSSEYKPIRSDGYTVNDVLTDGVRAVDFELHDISSRPFYGDANAGWDYRANVARIRSWLEGLGFVLRTDTGMDEIVRGVNRRFR